MCFTNPCNTNKFFTLFLPALAIVSLFASTTNLIALSAVFPALMLLYVPALYFLYIRNKQITILELAQQHHVTLFALFFYIISFASILLYDPQALSHFHFYRYDGNFIISYALFLVLPFSRHSLNLNKIILIFILFATLIHFPLWIDFVLHHSSPYFHPLFHSTNAAGGFFALLLSLLIPFISNQWYQKEKKKSFYSLLLLSVLLYIYLFYTSSRGSMLGLMAGLLSWLAIKKQKTIIIKMMFIIIVMIQAFLIVKFYPLYQQKISYISYQNIRHQHYENKKEENIYHRLLNDWPRAIDAFFRSPVVGYGFGSINDLPYENGNTSCYLFCFNSNKHITYSDAHAHHSYLHVLGEQGIIGLFFLILFWYHLYDYLSKQNKLPLLKDGLMLMYWTIIFSSFTEHRITTPSMLIPFSIVFWLYYGYPEKNNINILYCQWSTKVIHFWLKKW